MGFPIAYIRQPRERGIDLIESFPSIVPLLLRFQPIIAYPLHWYIRNIQVPILVRKAVRYAKEQHIGIVWAVLDNPTLIYLARRVAAALSVPLVVTVWDPPERFAVDRGMDVFSKKLLLHEFAKTLHAADRCSVASEGMQEEYKRRYGIESVVLIHGVHPDLRRPAAKKLNRADQFVIGIAGSLYAVQEWQALLSALSSVDWRLDGREVSLRLLGSDIWVHAPPGKMHIEYLGWRSLEETIDIMSQVDVTYVPYWFDKNYSLAVRLCFPNKLTTYLAAGRPVFFHGPEDSSPASFFRRFPVGLCCHSLEPKEIIQSLMRFVSDEEFYARAAAAGQVALDQELNLRVFLDHFAHLIGIDKGDLLPISDLHY
jgi:hypothetical protein